MPKRWSACCAITGGLLTRVTSNEYEGLSITPVTHAPTLFTQETWALARVMWDNALAIGEVAGYRNAQATVIAPTGTIGLVMDCDTTGIEPDFALVKFKKLAGGGYFKIVNQSVEPALRRLGYKPEQIAAIETFAKGTNTLEGAPHINRATLRAKGFDDETLAQDRKRSCSVRSRSASSSTTTCSAMSSARPSSA